MPYSGLSSNTPATEQVAIYNVKTLWKSLGWTILSSSDGSTYNSSGDQITSGLTGAGGLDNTNAWFVAQDPTAIRQWCIQRVGAATWRVKYILVVDGQFTAGSPGATRVPTATDTAKERVVLGSGSDASPTGATWFSGADGSYYHVGMASSVAPYGFWFAAYSTTSSGTASPSHGFMMDPLRDGYPSNDGDPAVYYLDGTSTAWASTQLSENDGSPGPQALLGSSHVRTSALMYYADTTSPEATVPSSTNDTGPFHGLYTLLPVFYFRPHGMSTEAGDKGWSSLMLLTPTTTPDQNNPVHVAGRSYSRIKIRAVVLPWDGTVPPGSLTPIEGFRWDDMEATNEVATASTTTTLPAIIEKMITTVEALTPAQVPSDSEFRRLDKRQDLRDWATNNNSTTACLRMFDVARTGDAEDPPLFAPDMIERNEEVTLTIAYPNKPGLYRTSAGSSDGANDLDDMDEVIRKDARQIRDALFSADNYVAGQMAAFVTIQAPDKSDEHVTFQDIVIRCIYREAQSL